MGFGDTLFLVHRWPPSCYVLTGGREGQEASSLMPLLIKALIPSWGSILMTSCNPITSQRPHVQMPPHRRLGLQHMNIRGCKHSVPSSPIQYRSEKRGQPVPLSAEVAECQDPKRKGFCQESFERWGRGWRGHQGTCLKGAGEGPTGKEAERNESGWFSASHEVPSLTVTPGCTPTHRIRQM